MFVDTRKIEDLLSQVLAELKKLNDRVDEGKCPLGKHKKGEK
jgi:hypothetical protein